MSFFFISAATPRDSLSATRRERATTLATSNE